MISRWDKALVAALGGVIVLVNNLTGLSIAIDPETLNAVVAVVMPIFVYLIPNKA